MKSFFISLITASAVGALSSALVCKSFEKYIRYIAALICTIIIVAPVSSLLPSIKSGAVLSFDDIGAAEAFASDGGALELIGDKTESETEAYIKSLVFSDLGINLSAVIIEIESVGSSLYIKRVAVTPEQSGDVDKLREYLEKLFGSETLIEVIA